MNGERPLGMEVAVPWLVWSHEHSAFWRANHCGYTVHIEKAGRYTRGEAELICKDANYGKGRTRIEPLDCDEPPNEICFPAPEAVDQLNEEIASLKTMAGEFADQMLGDRE